MPVVLGPCVSLSTPLLNPSVSNTHFPSVCFLTLLASVCPSSLVPKLTCPLLPYPTSLFSTITCHLILLIHTSHPTVPPTSIGLLPSLLMYYICSSFPYPHALTGHNDGVADSGWELSPNRWSSLCQHRVWQLWSTGVICSLHRHSGSGHFDPAGIL